MSTNIPIDNNIDLEYYVEAKDPATRVWGPATNLTNVEAWFAMTPTSDEVDSTLRFTLVEASGAPGTYYYTIPSSVLSFFEGTAMIDQEMFIIFVIGTSVREYVSVIIKLTRPEEQF